MTPGEYLLEDDNIEINRGRATVTIIVRNRGDRPVQVGSHCHFCETNRWLAFERERAFGMRLNIAAGTAVRFEPGEEKEIELTDFAGRRIIHGFNGFVEGVIDKAESRAESLRRAGEAGFLAGEKKDQR